VVKALFHSAETTELRCFWLFRLISSAEEQYDLGRRDEFFRLWGQIPEWPQNPYCRYLRSYLDGVTAFYQGHLLEAEHRWNIALNEAAEAEYIRGEIRCYFHLGLIYRDRGMGPKACTYWRLSLQRAQLEGWPGYIQRCHEQIKLIESDTYTNGTTSLSRPQLEMQTLFENRNFIAARGLYLRLARERRRLGVARGVWSDHSYLPILLQGLGHFRMAKRAFDHLSDRVLRGRCLLMREKIFGLNQHEAAELKWTQAELGFTKIIASPLRENTEISVAGIPLGSITSHEIRRFVERLLKSEDGLDKDELYRLIWGGEYDPVIHDTKIYKFIMRVRKTFPSDDVVLNKYGRYILNPRLR
jgi:hypothetical protein